MPESGDTDMENSIQPQVLEFHEAEKQIIRQNSIVFESCPVEENAHLIYGIFLMCLNFPLING